WLAVGGAPAIALPLRHPRKDAVADVLAVRVQSNAFDALCRAQGLDRRHHFHAVVGGRGFAAVQFAALAVLEDENAPAARPRITRAGAVCVNVDHSGSPNAVPVLL